MAEEVEIVRPESEACKRLKWLLSVLFLLGLISLPAYYLGRFHSTTQGNPKKNPADGTISYEGTYVGTYSSKQGQTTGLKIRIERDGSVAGRDQGPALGTTAYGGCTGHVIPSANQIACVGSASHTRGSQPAKQTFIGELRRQDNTFVGTGNFQVSNGDYGTWTVTKVPE
ncbi:hypothetical protein ACKFKG_13385 [Phormidesmis sp. 146-35]